jgi:hypothetical protein
MNFVPEQLLSGQKAQTKPLPIYDFSKHKSVRRTQNRLTEIQLELSYIHMAKKWQILTGGKNMGTGGKKLQKSLKPLLSLIRYARVPS